jgi:O-antigen ligase
LLDSNRWRRRAVLAFCIAVTAVLLISWGQALGIVPQRDLALLESGARMRNTVFKEYTQQGLTFLILAGIAFAAFLGTHARYTRLVLAGVVLLATANVLFLIDSRTALITIVMVMTYFVWRLAGPRKGPGIRQVVVLAISLGLGATTLWSLPVVHDRVVAVQKEINVYAAGRQPTPTGIRMEMWRHTVPMIEASPLWGHGLNRWGPMYRDAIRDLPDYPAFVADHPHQEYLWILAEEGVAGLLVFAVLMLALARHLGRLQASQRDAWACLMIIFLTAGLANCLWFDFSHRHVFILLLACIPLVTPAGDQKRGSPA